MSRRLLGTERDGNRVHKYWAHDDRKITVETIEDVEPAFRSVKQTAERQGKSDLRFKASIPQTLVDETCRATAPLWGVGSGDVFRELMANKTDRSKRVWRMLTDGRDYSKLQAKSY